MPGELTTDSRNSQKVYREITEDPWETDSRGLTKNSVVIHKTPSKNSLHGQNLSQFSSMSATFTLPPFLFLISYVNLINYYDRYK